MDRLVAYLLRRNKEELAAPQGAIDVHAAAVQIATLIRRIATALGVTLPDVLPGESRNDS